MSLLSTRPIRQVRNVLYATNIVGERPDSRTRVSRAGTVESATPWSPSTTASATDYGVAVATAVGGWFTPAE
jgi:hypothetical protein